MRTTLTIEDRIARDLKEIAHRSGKPLKVVVNETLQAGLAASQQKRKPRRYRLRTASLGDVRRGINLDKALAVADALEDEELARKMEFAKVKLVDANVLIYAVNSDAVHHERARSWLESSLSGMDRVGMPWIVLLAFLRITTRPGILERPLAVDDALAYVDSWLQQPSVELVVPGPGHWAILRSLILTSGTGGNLTSDAHLAALALEGGWTLVSTDNDFRRFTGLPIHNPASD